MLFSAESMMIRCQDSHWPLFMTRRQAMFSEVATRKNIKTYNPQATEDSLVLLRVV
jgi:hypothetical protein